MHGLWNRHAQRKPVPPAGSGNPAIFVQRLGLDIDVGDGYPGLHSYAWNLGLDQDTIFLSDLSGVTEILSLEQMSHFAAVSFTEIAPVYDFLDRPSVENAIKQRWAECKAVPYDPVDSLILGVAALGCLLDRDGTSPFDTARDLERRLVYSARVALEYSSQLPHPSISHVIAWLLRVIYLRLTSSPHATWMASCTLMHMIETTKLHFDAETSSPLARPPGRVDCTPEQRRKIYHTAQLFNTWISLDCGKSQVELHGASTKIPTVGEGGWTGAQVGLYQLSIFLAPQYPREFTELETALVQLSHLDPSHPMLKLLQCNIALCIFRRATALGRTLSDSSLQTIVSLMRGSLAAATELAARSLPWWHVLNIPFQIVCVVLAMEQRDAAEVVILGEALETVRLVATRYRTHMAEEAYAVAVGLVRRRRERQLEFVRVLDQTLEGHER
ncbi:fungal specific transcription factor domain-containing protein [Aspergillus mulundensis]|uniref:Xylanolytic transcriptional activator regulatory domain-containing protein n=1 Tax=Aspergillus mulundensis TaxID=1810919 RepID=A0A3D8RR12_9EURO|nr:Uncharacterized protein DSM5745_06514 [Aspergillus mulundensis]RDW76522.1 Uncharacterized protein DSM5745_06514 [Aspergillus mulundensis]